MISLKRLHLNKIFAQNSLVLKVTRNFSPSFFKLKNNEQTDNVPVASQQKAKADDSTESIKANILKEKEKIV